MQFFSSLLATQHRLILISFVSTPVLWFWLTSGLGEGNAAAVDRALLAGPRSRPRTPQPPSSHLIAPHGNLPLSLSWHDTARQSCGARLSVHRRIFSAKRKKSLGEGIFKISEKNNNCRLHCY